MSTLSSANVTDINLILKERTHKIKMKYLCINISIRTHILGNWPIGHISTAAGSIDSSLPELFDRQQD